MDEARLLGAGLDSLFSPQGEPLHVGVASIHPILQLRKLRLCQANLFKVSKPKDKPRMPEAKHLPCHPFLFLGNTSIWNKVQRCASHESCFTNQKS